MTSMYNVAEAMIKKDLIVEYSFGENFILWRNFKEEK